VIADPNRILDVRCCNVVVEDMLPTVDVDKIVDYSKVIQF